MSSENLNRATDIIETPRANISVLKQRIIEQKKKDRFKKTLIFSTIFVSIGALSLLS